MKILFILGLSSFLVALILTPLCRNLLRSWGMVDRPDQNRKLHTQPVATMGGIPIVTDGGVGSSQRPEDDAFPDVGIADQGDATEPWRQPVGACRPPPLHHPQVCPYCLLPHDPTSQLGRRLTPRPRQCSIHTCDQPSRPAEHPPQVFARAGIGSPVFSCRAEGQVVL